MGRHDVGRETFADDGEAVVLRRDRNGARRDVLDRMVRAAVPELQLEGRAAESEAEELVTEADAEDRSLRQEPFDRPDRSGEGRGIPRAVREEHAVRVPSEDLL